MEVKTVETVHAIIGFLGEVVVDMSDTEFKQNDGGCHTHHFQPSQLSFELVLKLTNKTNRKFFSQCVMFLARKYPYIPYGRYF